MSKPEFELKPLSKLPILVTRQASNKSKRIIEAFIAQKLKYAELEVEDSRGALIGLGKFLKTHPDINVKFGVAQNGKIILYIP